jgi:autotransporter translocation and assembly factor TamB
MRRTLFLFALLYSLSAAAEPPLILSITWDVVSVPLGGGDDLRMDDAALQLRHDGRRYALRLATDIQFGDTPLGRWHLSGTSEVWGRFDFELDAAPLRGTISGQGNVDWRKGLQWQALLEAAGLQLEALLPGVGGTTSLTAHGRSGETGSASDAEISIDNRTTEFHGAEVSGRGRVNLGERTRRWPCPGSMPS